jgi:hypothetical protein
MEVLRASVAALSATFAAVSAFIAFFASFERKVTKAVAIASFKDAPWLNSEAIMFFNVAASFLVSSIFSAFNAVTKTPVTVASATFSALLALVSVKSRIFSPLISFCVNPYCFKAKLYKAVSIEVPEITVRSPLKELIIPGIIIEIDVNVVASFSPKLKSVLFQELIIALIDCPAIAMEPKLLANDTIRSNPLTI